MPYEELLGWINYFEQRPVDWRDDDRTYKFLQTQGVKAKPGQIFPSLSVIYNPKTGEDDSLNPTKFKSSLMFHKLLSATKGDKINL